MKLPPLRERQSDLPAIVNAMLRCIGSKLGRGNVQIRASAVALLRAKPWPGNLVQLERVLEQCVGFSSSGVISKQLVRDVFCDSEDDVSKLRRRCEDEERSRLIEVLRLHHGNVTKAANTLGVSRTTAYNWMTRLGVYFGPATSTARRGRGEATRALDSGSPASPRDRRR